MQLEPCIPGMTHAFEHGYRLDSELGCIRRIKASYMATRRRADALVNSLAMIMVVAGKNQSGLDRIQDVARHILAHEILVRPSRITALQDVATSCRSAGRLAVHTVYGRAPGNITSVLCFLAFQGHV